MRWPTPGSGSASTPSGSPSVLSALPMRMCAVSVLFGGEVRSSAAVEHGRSGDLLEVNATVGRRVAHGHPHNRLDPTTRVVLLVLLRSAQAELHPGRERPAASDAVGRHEPWVEAVLAVRRIGPWVRERERPACCGERPLPAAGRCGLGSASCERRVRRPERSGTLSTLSPYRKPWLGDARRLRTPRRARELQLDPAAVEACPSRPSRLSARTRSHTKPGASAAPPWGGR